MVKVNDAWRHVIPFALVELLENDPLSAVAMRTRALMDRADRLIANMDERDAQDKVRDAVRRQVTVWFIG